MTQVFFSPAPLAACALGVLLYNMSAIQYQSDLRTGCSRIADVVKTIPARSLCRSVHAVPVQCFTCSAQQSPEAHTMSRAGACRPRTRSLLDHRAHTRPQCAEHLQRSPGARSYRYRHRYRALSHTRRTVLRAVYCSKQLTPGPLDRLMPQARQHLRPAATEATCLRPCSALRQR